MSSILDNIYAAKRDELREQRAKVSPMAIVDRKSTRLNSSHKRISYAVFCLDRKSVV